MPARHYALEYNVNNGPWIVGRADEAPGAGKQFEVPGLPVGTHAVKLRLVPLVGDPTPILSNEVILQMGNPGIAEPVQTVAQSEVTIADLMVRRDALIAAAGVVVSETDTLTMNEALLTSAGVTAEVVDNIGIRSTDNLEAAATVTATIADVTTMLEQVQAVVAAAATQTDGAVRRDAVSAAADVVAGLGSEVYTPGVVAGPSDNFNRADGGLGSDWTTVSGKIAPVISSQRVQKTLSDTTHAAYWSADTFTADQWAISRVYPEALFVNDIAATDALTVGPAVRGGIGSLGYHVSATNYNDLYDTELTGFTVTLWKNGVKLDYYTSGTLDEYTHLKITAIGSVITVYGGQSPTGPWTELITRTDPSPIATGSAGVVIGGGSYATLDDWSGGTV